MKAGEGTGAVGRRMVICQEIGGAAAAGERHPDFGDADRRTRAHGKHQYRRCVLDLGDRDARRADPAAAGGADRGAVAGRSRADR